MSLEFYKTQAGRRFYDGVMPRIANALERIATSMEEQQKNPTELEEDIEAPQELVDYTQNLVDKTLKDIEDLTRAAAEEAAKE